MYGGSAIVSKENNMKTIRIRKFTMLSLVFITMLPWIFFVTAHLIEAKTFRFDMSEPEKGNLNETIHLIEANSENWKDTSWQKQLSRHLQERNMAASIRSESNKVIFQTDAVRFKETEQFSIIQDGNLLGRVIIYQENSRTIQMIAAFSGLILAFIIIGFAMRRMILKPLEEMSDSARKIAEGDFDIRLPSSKITEIAEVHEGFEIMVKGLKESLQKQMELESERRFVIAAVAHDLRTPLFALRGYLDGLEQGIAQSPDKMAKYVAVCKEKSAQLDRLVEDLFTFTKTENMERKRNHQRVNLSQILRKSMNSLALQAKQKNIKIVDRDFQEDCMIQGDAHLLERAITNLLDNAVKFTPKDGEIVVQCDQQDDKVTVTIKDSGKGFSSEELQHMFEPLFRGEESRNRSTGGSGIGLTISQRIIRQHGGDLIAGNHPDGGAVMECWIPLAK